MPTTLPSSQDARDSVSLLASLSIMGNDTDPRIPGLWTFLGNRYGAEHAAQAVAAEMIVQSDDFYARKFGPNHDTI